MTHTIEIESAITTSAEDLRDALSARGLTAEVIETWPHARFRLTMEGTRTQIAGAVERALDAWLGERRLPFVPDAVGDSLVVLRPPAA